METAQSYVSKMRSSKKKEYARRYLLYRQTRVEPSPPLYPLSYMAAQAVRMEIDRLLEAEKEECT